MHIFLHKLRPHKLRQWIVYVMSYLIEIVKNIIVYKIDKFFIIRELLRKL